MKLNKSDRIKYDNSVYAVLAVVWSTVYLQKVSDNLGDFDYTMDQVYELGYKDIEVLGDRKETE